MLTKATHTDLHALLQKNRAPRLLLGRSHRQSPLDAVHGPLRHSSRTQESFRLIAGQDHGAAHVLPLPEDPSADPRPRSVRLDLRIGCHWAALTYQPTLQAILHETLPACSSHTLTENHRSVKALVDFVQGRSVLLDTHPGS